MLIAALADAGQWRDGREQERAGVPGQLGGQEEGSSLREQILSGRKVFLSFNKERH